MPHRQFLKMLGATELFHEVPAAVLAEIGATARQQHFSANTRIFRQGEPDARAHLVIAGNVRISQSGSDGEQIVVRFIGPQETFGTVSLFTDRQYPAEAVTVVETLEASWSRADIIGLIKQCPQIGLNALGIVGARLQEAQERMRELSTQSAKRRVAHAVIRLARQVGVDSKQGKLIALPLRRKDIADISGTTLHTASRILTGWEKSGHLTRQNRRITVCHLSIIADIAAGFKDE